MSDKEKIVQLLDKVPEYKLGYILAYVQGITAGEDIKKLKGYDDVLRLRVGTYRIIYTVDNGKLT